MVELPRPLQAVYPDGGNDVSHMFECRGCDHMTAHEGGEIRVWRGFLSISGFPQREMRYYPIDVIGMTEGEIERAVAVAKGLLDINRKSRRALDG